MKQVTLYHRKANGKVKTWECWVDGLHVFTQWSQDGGKKNRTHERPGPKRDLDGFDTAIELFKKRVARKLKKGYVRHLDDVVADIRVDDRTLNFDRLPKSFAPAKPIKTYDPDEMAKWAAEDLLFIQRKRDGMRHYLVSDTEGRLKVYSSGKDDMTEHLQPLIVDIKLPPRTILDCELVVTEPGKQERDGFLIVSGIARSLPERARSQIALAQRMGARVQLMAFDLLWYKGDPIYRKSYSVRYGMLAKTIEKADQATEGRTLVRMPLVTISPTRLATLNEALDMVEKFKWEGLVVWRKDQATVVQVNGSPKRVNCWKLKPIGEEDVIATGYALGKGKNAKVVGKFLIAEWRRGKGGKWAHEDRLVPMGRCGTGLDDETRKAALSWKYPCVIQIEYDQKSEKGFRFPVFIRKRDDKKVADCGC
jgi:ATP-dependent DNA ligase